VDDGSQDAFGELVRREKAVDIVRHPVLAPERDDAEQQWDDPVVQ
jgi:hypothetical protein